MKPYKFIFIFFLLFLVAKISAQEEYIFESDCWNTCWQLHLTSEGNVIVTVNEHCNESDLRGFVCTPQDGFLIPQLTFETEVAGDLFSTDLGFYLISRSSENYFIRFIGNDLIVQSEVILDLVPNADVKEIYVDNGFLVVAYFGLATFYIERFDLATGEVLETVSYTGLPPIGDFQTNLIIHNEDNIYIGLECGWIFKVDPMNLSETELLPLPYSEEFGGEYIPCFPFGNVLRPNPDEAVLFTASEVFFNGDYYSFDFGYSGEHLGTDFIPFTDDYNLRDFTFDEAGNRFVIYQNDIDADEDNELPSRVHGVFKVNVDNEIIGSLVFDTESVGVGYFIRLVDDVLHFHGSKFIQQLGDASASYLTIDTSNFTTSVQSNEVERPRFIQTHEQFGVLTSENVLSQQVYDLSGTLYHTTAQTTLWQKSDFAPGTYVLRVETTTGMYSYLIVVQ